MDNQPELPDPVPFDPANPPTLEELPELPDGYKWEVKISADADVIHEDGTVN
jgi:hypothetical protein